MEQLLGALPIHLLAVLLERQAPAAAASGTADSRLTSVDVEPGTAEPAEAGRQPAPDGLSRLPAAYLKKGLMALSHLADLAARTPLAQILEVPHASYLPCSWPMLLQGRRRLFGEVCNSRSKQQLLEQSPATLVHGCPEGRPSKMFAECSVLTRVLRTLPGARVPGSDH